MSSRRDFLKSLGSGLVTVLTAPLLLESCAGGLRSYRPSAAADVVIVPKSELESPKNRTGILLVQTGLAVGPLVLRKVGKAGVVALSPICSHRGCEVRSLPDGFTCPCHGSEYDELGSVLEGPATRPLARFPVEETKDAYKIKVR